MTYQRFPYTACDACGRLIPGHEWRFTDNRFWHPNCPEGRNRGRLRLTDVQQTLNLPTEKPEAPSRGHSRARERV